MSDISNYDNSKIIFVPVTLFKIFYRRFKIKTYLKYPDNYFLIAIIKPQPIYKTDKPKQNRNDYMEHDMPFLIFSQLVFKWN